MKSDENPYFDAGAASSGSAGGAGGDAGASTTATTSLAAPSATQQRPQTPATPGEEQPPAIILPPSLARTVQFRPLRERAQSSIRLRRTSVPPAPRPNSSSSAGDSDDQNQSSADNGLWLKPPSRLRFGSGTRSRAGSNAVPLSRLPTIPDGVAQNFDTAGAESSQGGGQTGRPISTASEASSVPAVLVQSPDGTRAVPADRAEYDSNIVDLLDVIDPEVATLSSITNVQNSLFIPSLGRFVNRRPTYDLSFAGRIPGAYPEGSDEDEAEPTEPPSRRTTLTRTNLNRTYSITSEIMPTHYAVLPSGATLDGWTEEEIDQLNDHVRHMLHSRRSKIKRGFKAFGMYVRRPLGFAVTLYATLITLFGLAWVLFLIGWIYVGDKQLYAINVIDNVLVALFAVVGDGMAPFRAVDTYHLIFIVYYHRLTWKLRKQSALPDLENKNDLPTESLVPTQGHVDLEAARLKEARPDGHEVSVLTPKQQARLTHHQDKMFKSHTFYKPHETETHHAFPLSLLIAIILLLDLHSCLQISLGSVTWSTDYHHRSAAVTTTILCCSITANTTAGIVIAIGDRRTRKKDVIERMLRQELTDQAMRKVEKERAAREAEEAAARKDVTQVGRFDASSHNAPRISEEILSRDFGKELGIEEPSRLDAPLPPLPQDGK